MMVTECGCKLGRKCADHAYCPDGGHEFNEYCFDRWVGVGVGSRLQHVTVRQCANCDRHESEVK